MSSSQIPNLNTLRRGGIRTRGLGDLPAGGTSQSKDDIIRNTDNDAATSRLSAVDAGYLVDPFAKLLTSTPIQRRLPLMNRGTYARTKGIDKLVDTFLASQPGRKQIISLGAGSDTRYFRLKARQRDLDVLYHEIDFEANVKSKTTHLNDAAEAVQQLSGIELKIAESRLISPNYHLHAMDLRTLGSNNAKLSGIQDLPTLLISECCLIYLSPQDADAVLTYFASIVPSPIAIVIYEPVRPNDAFGRTMVKNLISRGIHLQTLERYAELGDQRQRLNSFGFTSRAVDIDFVWRIWVDEEEKERIDSLEWLDEVEEFVLLGRHYCIAWGWKGFHNDDSWQQVAAE